LLILTFQRASIGLRQESVYAVPRRRIVRGVTKFDSLMRYPFSWSRV
jgi:hypothetical protein